VLLHKTKPSAELTGGSVPGWLLGDE